MPTLGNEEEAALQNLLFQYLGIKPEERVVFIHDQEYRRVSPVLKSVAEGQGVRCDCIEIEHDGIKVLDATVGKLLVGSDYSVIVFGTVHNIWHTPERRSAKYDLNKRLAALVCAPDDIGGAASFANARGIGAVARELAPYFKAGMTVNVTTPAGSRFSARIGIPFCEHANYDVPGTGGDFPSGEVGFGPEEGSVSGQVVYDVKMQHIGVLDEPLRLEVKNDRVLRASGSVAGQFETICAKRGDILNYISEISIGLNPLASVTPARAYIPEEKMLGTLHCGHGGNSSYGQRQGPHLDGVMARPTVEVGGRILIKDGVINADLLQSSTLKWLSEPI